LGERDWDADAIVQVSARAAAVEGSRLRLRANEHARAGELLEAMLVASSNDACVALVEHAAGSRAAFAARMNQRAAALGMRRSFFGDPCGFDQGRQRSTPNDLLRLTYAALAVPDIARAVEERHGELRTLEGRSLTYRSTNLMLGRFDGAQGVKTGFTTKAGHCLIALAQRGATTVIVVLLNARDRWWTAEILIEEAFRVSASNG
jgi:D-alanyl-D-alanine carboxypeptidase (penicillin-binding protein 5/6)